MVSFSSVYEAISNQTMPRKIVAFSFSRALYEKLRVGVQKNFAHSAKFSRLCPRHEAFRDFFFESSLVPQ
jgi:hypothetical protein